MLNAVDQLSPRQRECLRLVWDRQASSKEIAAELGISKATVDGYIAEAVKALGARDRRDAARLAFGGSARVAAPQHDPAPSDAPPAVSGGDAARVPPTADPLPIPTASTTVRGSTTRPWATADRPRNTLTFVQTVGWVAVIAIGSLLALTLATVIGNGLPPVAAPTLRAIDRLTQ